MLQNSMYKKPTARSRMMNGVQRSKIIKNGVQTVKLCAKEGQDVVARPTGQQRPAVVQPGPTMQPSTQTCGCGLGPSGRTRANPAERRRVAYSVRQRIVYRGPPRTAICAEARGLHTHFSGISCGPRWTDGVLEAHTTVVRSPLSKEGASV